MKDNGLRTEREHRHQPVPETSKIMTGCAMSFHQDSIHLNQESVHEIT
jgi:hypothetical protein